MRAGVPIGCPVRAGVPMQSDQLQRREFISLLAGAAASWPLAARAQSPRKVPRIGVLLPCTAASFALRTKALLEGLRDLGYVEGQTIAIEWRWGQDRVEGFRSLPPILWGAMPTSLLQAERRRPRHAIRDRNDTDCDWQSSAIRSLPVLWPVLRGRVERHRLQHRRARFEREAT